MNKSRLSLGVHNVNMSSRHTTGTYLVKPQYRYTVFYINDDPPRPRA